jgi:tetratricopeptide (TPR) repeat protein
MPTKLSRYCEGLMEAAWLAAVILVPLFFNVYSSRIFEPDKITLLRTLALVILAAWFVKIFDEGGINWERLRSGNINSIFRIPLVIPILALVLAYIISTIFSVSPLVSLLGSYQRLQGTYTTFSYLVVFAAIVGNLRKRVQIDRLITTIILTSLPIALYGILQRYQLDPVPWGGDTSIRIAANMGNSIFVAAYLIMVFPLTVGKIVQAFTAILSDDENLVAQVARGTAYVFIGALELIALYMSGSRGPALGWMAGSFFLFLLLSMHYRKRWLTLSVIGAALAMGVFLGIFNIPNGPLQGLRSSPAIGRFGLLLDAESNSALVRKYIWEGAAKLVAPHAPLEYPDGSQDKFNVLRPIIGYGPESMYVAYNPFYVPDLAHVEKRNASPDRSHNETWDSLVITGGIGLIVYILLYVSVFYYGLKWIGLVVNQRFRNIFLLLSLGGGGIGAIGLSAWRGIEYLGVGLPLGILAGLLAYLILAAIYGNYESPRTPTESIRSLTLMVLFAAILAHFVEINFGIAIAVTRTYFWVFTGLMLVVGYILPERSESENGNLNGQQTLRLSAEEKNSSKAGGRKKKRAGKYSSRRAKEGWPAWFGQAMVACFIIGVILSTLGFDYISNMQGSSSATSILWNSFTRLRGTDSNLSFGILALILTTWIVASIVFTAERQTVNAYSDGVKMLATISGISIVLGLFFWIWHAGALASLATTTSNDLSGILQQIGRYEGLLTRFYIYILVLTFAGGAFLIGSGQTRMQAFSWRGGTVAPILLVVTSILASSTNLRVVQADIAFKLADPFTKGNSWPVAIAIYNRSLELAPREDYYYLFLGRAYLEQAKTLTDPTEQDKLITQAASDLKRAQSINPLNTDHTANLARLYSLWASFSSDPSVKEQKAKISADYFAKAVNLSPNNARLWDEYALVYLNLLQQPDQAHQYLNRALSLDTTYDWTYALLAEYYLKVSQTSSDPNAKKQALDESASNYRLAYRYGPDRVTQANYMLALGQLYINSQQNKLAIDAIEEAIRMNPTSQDLWKYEQTIAQLYVQDGDKNNALVHANNALSTAPADQKSTVENLIGQIQVMP